MKKKDWFLIAAGLIFTWLVDQVTKQWALGLGMRQTYGPLNFVLHYNPGAILGTFSDLPPVLRIVTLSTGGAFLVFSFVIIQYILAPRAIILRVGMGILLGGILGNVTDRILTGRIVDFIVFKFGNWYSPAFNVADALQWVGYAMVVHDLFKEGKNLWPTQNNRKSFWINPSYQLRYASKITVFGLCFAFIAGTLSYTYLKVTIHEVAPNHAAADGQFLFPFSMTFLAVSAIFCILLFFVGLILSHKSAGPVYAFGRFINEAVNGEARPLKLRQGDEFIHLEEIAKKVLQRWPESQKPASSTPPSATTPDIEDKKAAD